MSEAAAPIVQARFVNGSTMRHVAVMTFTGALGLMALFLVDLADLFYLSLLGRTEVTAAIGYAGTIPFAWYGAEVAGPEGVLAGTALGSVIFGITSVAAAYRIVGRIAATAA